MQTKCSVCTAPSSGPLCVSCMDLADDIRYETINNVEMFKAINQYPGYEISNIGDVYHIPTDSIIYPWIGSGGYLHVELENGFGMAERRVHRLVAHAFLPNYLSDYCVGHLDKDILNNVSSNLKMTQSYTHQEKYKECLKNAEPAV